MRQLIEDFAGPLQMYKRAHVFFSNRASFKNSGDREGGTDALAAAQSLRSVC